MQLSNIKTVKKLKWAVGILTTLLLSSLLLMLNIHLNIKKAREHQEALAMQKKEPAYYENPQYLFQTSMYPFYPKSKTDIVMMGSSHTQMVNWDELLPNNYIKTRGIGSDIVEGYHHRLNDILMLTPTTCFIEMGTNDIIKNTPLDSFYNYAKSIIDTFTLHGIHTYIVLCFYASTQYENYIKHNLKVDSINSILRALHPMHNINLNTYLYPQKSCDTNMYQADGIHLKPAAYILWKKEIEKCLKIK